MAILSEIDTTADGSMRVGDGRTDVAVLCAVIGMAASSSVVDGVLPAEVNVIRGVAEAKGVGNGVLDE